MQNQNNTQPLYAAMEELQRMPKVDIKGRKYATVASRVEAFRRHFPAATIETKLVYDDEQRVIIQAQIRVDSILIATGFAEEFRGNGLINATSALENAETSAIGRGLSAAGLMGGEYASSFEVANAITQQQQVQINNVKSKNIDGNGIPAPTNAESYHNSGKVEQTIVKLGLGIEPMPDGTYGVTGKSYPHAQDLRRLGCTWKPTIKRWILPSDRQDRAA